MGTITSHRSIDASPEAVFDAMSQPENLSDINPDIVNVEFISEQHAGLGTRFRETRLMNGKEATTELEYTEHVAPERVRIVADSGGAIWDTVMSIAPREDGGSELTMVMEDRPYKLGAKIFVPLMRRMIAKALEQDMDRLKVFCEKSGD